VLVGEEKLKSFGKTVDSLPPFKPPKFAADG
jgi:hypothetical protein